MQYVVDQAKRQIMSTPTDQQEVKIFILKTEKDLIFGQELKKKSNFTKNYLQIMAMSNGEQSNTFFIAYNKKFLTTRNKTILQNIQVLL